MPSWSREMTWYHLYPLGFLGAERENPAPGAADGPMVHRLRALEPWLDYLVELGPTGVLLGPVFESETHGYDTVDYLRVDRRLGDEDDLVWLFDACHRRGLRVLLDGVFNHVGRGFAPFADVVQRRDASPSAGLFHLDFGKGGPDGFAYRSFEGHHRLVTLNHASGAVLELTTDAARYWLERGADGYRLDAAYAVPVDFWRRFAAVVRDAFPETFLLGEVIHGDYVRFVEESTLDSVTQYELWKAIWSGLNDRNFFELAWALGRHQEFCQVFLPFTFVGNHDVTRIASKLREPRHLGHALAILFTVPGTPAVYAGDEQGWRGVKHERVGGDDEIRPAFPPRPSDLGEEGQRVFRLHQELFALRRRYPWLAGGTLEVLQVANRQLAYRVLGPGDQSLVCALNVDDEPASLEARIGAGSGRAPRHEVGQEVELSVTGDQLRIASLPPHSWTVYSFTE